MGKFTDNVSGKAFGDIIGKMKNLYSIHLYFDSEQFGNRAAASLALALKVLKNLHIFKASFSPYSPCIMTQDGFEKIKASLKTLSSIEIFIHDFEDNDKSGEVGNKIANYNFSLIKSIF